VADGQLLTQALVQLASNACQHTSRGATIWIGAKADGASARLWVRDDGDGVPAEQAERIFQRFTRGTARGHGSGAGLGLSIVRAIAEAHGGSARLVPHAGRGAWFEIVLPARPSSGEVVDRGPLAHTART
jgi:signal transduction histidine kinase